MIGGLSQEQLTETKTLLSTYPQIEKATLFGSRAIGTYKNGSDVDIAIFGEQADFLLAARVKEHLEEETYLPFFFDLIAFNAIESEDLKRHINDKGVLLYTKDKP